MPRKVLTVNFIGFPAGISSTQQATLIEGIRLKMPKAIVFAYTLPNKMECAPVVTTSEIVATEEDSATAKSGSVSKEILPQPVWPDGSEPAGGKRIVTVSGSTLLFDRYGELIPFPDWCRDYNHVAIEKRDSTWYWVANNG